MARPIKFRFWKTETREWINFPSRGVLSFENLIHPDYTDSNYFVIQQFTGLLDKNGKEIYEGDILLYPNGLTYIVRFGQYKHCDLWGIELNGWYVTRQMWDWPLDSIGEIVGNIFETPDLLK